MKTNLDVRLVIEQLGIKAQEPRFHNVYYSISDDTWYVKIMNYNKIFQKHGFKTAEDAAKFAAEWKLKILAHSYWNRIMEEESNDRKSNHER